MNFGNINLKYNNIVEKNEGIVRLKCYLKMN